MKVPHQPLVSIEIDKLTNSIENVVTGESFETVVAPVSAVDLTTTTKKNGWLFNWRQEARQPAHQVFKFGFARTLSAEPVGAAAGPEDLPRGEWLTGRSFGAYFF